MTSEDAMRILTIALFIGGLFALMAVEQWARSRIVDQKLFRIVEVAVGGILVLVGVMIAHKEGAMIFSLGGMMVVLGARKIEASDPEQSQPPKTDS